MQPLADDLILERAASENRVVVTHDADFGQLAIPAARPLFGILFLRPGHISPEPVIRAIEAACEVATDVSPPFIIVAQWSGHRVLVRLRRVPN
jgi:predicted nuclease of predicted toxin-antitoxin system